MTEKDNDCNDHTHLDYHIVHFYDISDACSVDDPEFSRIYHRIDSDTFNHLGSYSLPRIFEMISSITLIYKQLNSDLNGDC